MQSIPSKLFPLYSVVQYGNVYNVPWYDVVAGVQLDLAQMMSQKEKAVSGLTNGVAALLKANKVCYQFTVSVVMVTDD